MSEESARRRYAEMEDLSYAEEPPRFIRDPDCPVYPAWMGDRVEFHFVLEGQASMVSLVPGRRGTLRLPGTGVEVVYDLRRFAHRFVRMDPVH